MAEPKICIVVLNWNGEEFLGEALESLQKQSQPVTVLLVDNASTDGSMHLVRSKFPDIMTIINAQNLGFAGGVNTGIRYALNNGFDYVGLFNNDAVADSEWAKNLAAVMENDGKTGIVTCKFLNQTGEYIDSTGDFYSIWGLTFPRGRREAATNKYDEDTVVFGASGGASLYRTQVFKDIGLFDEDFVAYYEDVDVSFRAQLAGWKVAYQPKAVAYHRISATNSKRSGYGTLMTIKNLPWLLVKNVPGGLMSKVLPRFLLAYSLFFFGAILRGQPWPALKGFGQMIVLLPKKLLERRRIQSHRKVSARYINSIIAHDLPPNAHKLRALRGFWWTLSRRK